MAMAPTGLLGLSQVLLNNIVNSESKPYVTYPVTYQTGGRVTIGVSQDNSWNQIQF